MLGLCSGVLPGDVEAVLGGDDAPLGPDRLRRERGAPAATVPGALGARQTHKGMHMQYGHTTLSQVGPNSSQSVPQTDYRRDA